MLSKNVRYTKALQKMKNHNPIEIALTYQVYFLYTYTSWDIVSNLQHASKN